MMMGSQGSPAESGVLALIELMSDPKRYEARLAALRAAADEAEREQADSRIAKAAAEEALHRARAATQLSIEAEKRAQESSERAVNASLELDKRETALTGREAEAVAKARELTDFDKVLSAKAAGLAERDEQLVMLEEAAASLKADYESRLAKLQHIAAGA